MTTTVTPSSTAPVGDRPSVRVATNLAGELFWYGLLWLGIVVLGVVAGNVGSAVFGEGVEQSVGWSAVAIPRYVLLTGGILLAVSYLPLHVGLGATRRQFLVGALPSLALVAVASAVVATVLLAVEGLAYDALDWPHTVADRAGGDRPQVEVDLATAAVTLGVVYVLHVVSGVVGAAAFMRGGWFLGALALPLAAVPAAVGEVLIGGKGPGSLLTDWMDIDPPTLPVVALVGLVVAALGSAVAFALLRRVPLDVGDVAWWR